MSRLLQRYTVQPGAPDARDETPEEYEVIDWIELLDKLSRDFVLYPGEWLRVTRVG